MDELQNVGSHRKVNYGGLGAVICMWSSGVGLGGTLSEGGHTTLVYVLSSIGIVAGVVLIAYGLRAKL